MVRRDRPRWSLAALVSAAAFAATAVVTTRTGWGVDANDAVDSWVLNELPEGLRRHLSDAARPLVIVVLAPLVAVLGLLALARRAWRRAVAGVLIPCAATVVALGLPVQRLLGVDGGFPSHHASAGLGLLAGLAVVWPWPVHRRWLLVLAGAGLLVALGNVSWHAHQPRDVVGSALVVAFVATAAFALLGGDSPNLWRDTHATGRPQPDGPDEADDAGQPVRRTPTATPGRAPRRSPPM